MLVAFRIGAFYMTVMLQAALEYAKSGWAVFPARADKTPFTEHGVLDATTDEKQIREWWTAYPQANIGFDVGGAGLAVVDFDPGSEPDTVARALSLGRTALVQATPRGGEHRFYELADGEIVAPSSSKIADHVDVRSFHSYVLLAPSRTADGEYTWIERGEPAFRSDAFVRAANLAKAKSADREKWLIEPDLPEHVEQATEWLQSKAKVAIMFKGGDNAAYATAAHLISFGISEELAFDLMLQHWNPRCDPPWGPDELDHLKDKVEHAYSYNTSPPGNLTRAYHRAKSAKLFAPLARTQAVGSEAEAGDAPGAGQSVVGSKFRIVDRLGLDAILPPSWLVRDLLPCAASGLLYGPSQAFKTFLTLDLLLSICCAEAFPWAGTWNGQVLKPGPVLMVVGEGRDNIRKRVRAWENEHLGGRKAPNFYLMDPVPSVVEDPEDFVAVAKAMSETYAVIALDTVGKAMRGADENSSGDVGFYDDLTRMMIQQFDATVLGIAHTGLDNPDRPRGSGAFEGNADFMIKAKRPSMADKLTSLQVTKQKDGDDWEDPRWWALHSVGEGDDNTLVPRVGEAPTPAARRREKAPKEEAPNKVAEQINIEVLDKAVMKVLGGNRSRRWKTSDLATAVAHLPEVGIGSKMLQARWLRILREEKGTKAHVCFDPSVPTATGQWCFRD